MVLTLGDGAQYTRASAVEQPGRRGMYVPVGLQADSEADQSSARRRGAVFVLPVLCSDSM